MKGNTTTREQIKTTVNIIIRACDNVNYNIKRIS